MEKPNKKWYIVQVVSNYEHKVKDALEQRDFQQDEDKDSIEQIFLPMMSHQTKAGILKKKPMFPGYIFIKVNMTDESWYIIRNTPFVTGIVGSSGQRTKPTPIPDEQIQKIINRMKEETVTTSKEILSASDTLIEAVNFVEEDEILIKEGDFVNQTGIVKSISIPKQLAEIELDLFGRKTIIELPLKIIKKT